MQIFSIPGTVFYGVTNSMAKIKNGAKAGFGFVLTDDVGLDLTTTRNDRRQSSGVALEQPGEIALQLRK